MVGMLIDTLAAVDAVGFLYYLYIGDVKRATLFAIAFVILVLISQ